MASEMIATNDGAGEPRDPADEPDVVLRCTGLRKRYGTLRAVADVSFTIAAGETYGLLGPNGAGKTTTISMVCGLLARDGGEVTVAGEPMHPEAVAAKQHVGLVPQELAVYPDLTGRENLGFFARLYGLAGAERDRRTTEVLTVVGLRDRADDRVEEYSGGMKRRLNIALGMLHTPRLLVLDEPTVGVDPQSRNAILEAVERLSGEGMAVLYTTHYMEEAQRLCDRVGIIDQGRIEAEGTHRELVALVGERTRVTMTVSGDAGGAARACASVDGVASADAGDGQVTCLVEDAAGRLPALIDAVTNQGATLGSVQVDEPDLEAVFLHLTGRALRD